MHGPLRALKRDLDQLRVDTHIREIVVQALGDLGFLEKPPRARTLRLIQKPSRTKKKP